MITEFEITVLYSQIIVRVSNVEPPMLVWTDEHTIQGFSWTPTAVAFGVPDHDGECLIQVDTPQKFEIGSETLWAIRVPFDVPSAPLSIGAVHLTQDVPIPQGRYSLIFEALPGDFTDGEGHAYVLRLSFVLDPEADYEILKVGEGISTDTVLKKGA